MATKLDLDFFTRQMVSHAEAIDRLARGISDEQARWKPDERSWSILEVINHLCDEEREDFRDRLDILLHRTGELFPKIDPESWVAGRRYNERNLGESLDGFARERQASILWIGELKDPKWDAVYEQPKWRVTAADIFASWVAHDILHMRQLVRLRWLYTLDKLKPHKTDYAGSW